ncbi:large ribosomal subunit protein bL28-like [Oscarella lobularis]|uniref:large ribosomal subunit protein bL28-like n=1 Tax=Oscarella lobularis TaxID=121494 RepID=UPI0033138E7A
MVRLGSYFPCLKSIPKRAREGLFAGKGITFGHRVTFSNKKTKRTWKPNSQRRTYESEIMARSYTMNVTTAAMRWIDKAGGFDPYLLHTPDRKLASDFGSQLKRDMWTKIEEKGDGGVDVPKKARRVPRKPAWWSENEGKETRTSGVSLRDILPVPGEKLPPPNPEYAAAR